jgi:hypothetical protein
MSKKISDLNISFRPLWDLVYQSVKTNLLISGVNLGVFNVLTDWKDSKEVAELIKGHPENTSALLDALASIDLIKKSNGKYQNTPLSNTFLVVGKPTYIGGFVTISNLWNISSAEIMTQLIKDGPPPSNPNATLGSMDLWAQILRSAGNSQRAGIGQTVARVVSQLPEFPTMNRMLDLGGGAGLIGICIVDSHPTMEGVIFDQPAVVQVADEFIKEYNMETRVKTMRGNYMTDNIGQAYDFVLASQTLGLAGNELDIVLKKVYNSLNLGGVLMTMHEGLTFEKTKPSSMVLASVGTVLRGSKEMRFFEAGETAEAMRQAGFKSIYRFPIELDCGEEEITIARK